MEKAIIESIKKMPINGDRLELPQEQLDNYPAVKRILLKAGGAYKKNGFIFTKDPQEIKNRLCGGETVDDKRKLQAFLTPPALAVRVVKRACILDGMSVLEPSAGDGRLVQAVLDTDKLVGIAAVELNGDYIMKLAVLCNLVEQGDFLAIDPKKFGTYDRIVANPPFTKNQDIAHVLHMLKFLKPGGRLVSIMSNSWRTGSYKKQAMFRKKMEELNAEIDEIPAGAFRESGNGIASCMVVIQT